MTDKNPAKKKASKGKIPSAKKPKKPGNWYNPSKYTHEMCGALMEMMSEGKGQANFCARHNISRVTFDTWRKDHPEFDETYQAAKEKCEAWWQDMAQKHLTYNSFGTQMNPVIWSMNMRNRFGWTEHRRVSVPRLSTGKSFAEKFDILTQHIESGNLTSSEITALSSVLATGVKIAESAEMMDRLSKLEQAVEQAKENDAVG